MYVAIHCTRIYLAWRGLLEITLTVPLTKKESQGAKRIQQRLFLKRYFRIYFSFSFHEIRFSKKVKLPIPIH